MKEKLCLCSQHLKQKRAGSTACRAYMDNVETLLHPTCSLQGLDLFCFFFQGHAAVKGKELKAWKIQEVKGAVLTFLKFIINRR